MIEYRPIKRADIPRIIELYEQYLNSGASISEQIRTFWEDGSYMGYMAVSGSKPVGLMTVRQGIAFTYPHPELEAELDWIVQGKRIANCDALLVMPEYRKTGIAHAMAAHVRELLQRISYDYFLAEIWIYPDGQAPGKSTLESVGDLIWQRRIDGFYRDLADYGMSCPLCGERCVCGAWIDLMEL